MYISAVTSPIDTMTSSAQLLGSRLRRLVKLLDDAVADLYVDCGLDWYRPRFSPIIRVLAESGSASVRELADATGVTHSASSQTVAQMADRGLVLLSPGKDGRQRIVRLTSNANKLLPIIEAEWVAIAQATVELETELPFPLSRLVNEVFEALQRRSMQERIGAAVSTALAEHRVANPDYCVGGGLA